MASFTIHKGLTLPLEGAPETTIRDLPASTERVLYPVEDFPGLKLRALVKEGDAVPLGGGLFFNKKNPDFKICSPAAGTVTAIEFGPRRTFARVVIEANGSDEAVVEDAMSEDGVLKADRATLIARLQAFGLSALIRTRPFGRIMDPGTEPKSIFVNAMATAPFQPDINVVLPGQEGAFRIGMAVLTRLTSGKVHLCLDGAVANADALTASPHAEVSTFTGPHPAGNTSVHIHHLDPIAPGDLVWATTALDVLRIGQLFATGRYPATRVISIAGPGLVEGAAGYYRVAEGASLAPVLMEKKAAEEVRCISGSAFYGPRLPTDTHARMLTNGITVLREGRERLFLGWLLPGLSRFSASRAYASTWLTRKPAWNLGTSQNGELRPMVVTGLYDKYQPINIMTDFLVRAVLAKDSTEAIQLGILETMPEDFAVSAFACPSKMDLCGVIQKGLNQIEEEGI